MGAAAVVATIAGTAISAYSQYKQGEFQQEIADRDALLAGYNRADVMQRMATESSRLRALGRSVASRQLAAVAANGIDATTGSAGNLFAATEQAAELDAITAQNNAARAAWGFDFEAASRRTQGQMARTTSYLGSVGTAIGGLGQAIDQYSRIR